MNPVAKALWFIESHYTKELTLDDVAEVCGVSRYHLSRVFGIAVGCSPIRYVRGRRLTEAARALANGAPDILGVALGIGVKNSAGNRYQRRLVPRYYPCDIDEGGTKP